MKRIGKSYIDERLRWPEGVCVHCGALLDQMEATKEHVPSKCLLREPYPEELITMEACRNCNEGFSRDEQYLFALLAAVQAGSTNPQKQMTPKAARVFRRQLGLRKRIEESRREQQTLFGESEIAFFPELDRVNRVVVKNARCHALYELDQAMFGEPDHVIALPVQWLTPEKRDDFESIEGEISGWAEIGTRMFQRQCRTVGLGQSDLWRSWVIVQEGVYRYAAQYDGDAVLVRSVIQEYLATEVSWSSDN